MQLHCLCINYDHDISTIHTTLTGSDMSLSTIETSINDGANGTYTDTSAREITNSNRLSNTDSSDVHILSSNYECNDRHDISVNTVSQQEEDSSCDMMNLNLRTKGLNIGHINIQGLSGKIDQLNGMLQSNLVHIMGISETKLHDVHPDSAFDIDGYQTPIFRRDRKDNGGGGLIVFVKNGLSCNRRRDLESDNIECIWVEVKPKNSKSFLVGNVYRPPNSTIQWQEHFEDCMETVLTEEKEIYVLGDFNRDLFTDQISKTWLDYMEDFGVTQLVSKATRATPTSSTLIDHIYSNCSENVACVNVPKIGMSDHYPIFFTRKIHGRVPQSGHHTITYRSFKDFDETSFLNDLSSVPWNIVRVFDDPNDMVDTWSNLFLEVVNRHVPLKQHRVKRENQPQWLTPEILDAIKTRDKFKSIGNDAQYRIWRNKVTQFCRDAKKVQYEEYIEKNKENPSSIYKLFKEIGAGKGKQKSSTISSLRVGEKLIDDSPGIANTFNDFFVTVAAKLKEPISNSSHCNEKLKEFCQSKLPENTKFLIPEINKEKVQKYLSGIDITKATGIDNIGPRLLKLSASYIADEITSICNKSFETSTFPKIWKEAKVTPLHKNGSCDEANNYRPISILPILSKLIEKHVHDSLLCHLNEHQLLHDTQSGFRPRHSCETALVHMIDSWLRALDNGKLIGVVLVDFRKAFDLVDQEILLSKLNLYGVSENTLEWFKSYLKDRRQKVSINNVLSDVKPVTCGVPQGSILGPLMFLIFINDLPLYTSNVITDLYADDTTLYDVSESIEDIQINLQLALNNLDAWCKVNGMLVNTDKTKLMLIATPQKRSRLGCDTLNLKYKNDKLKAIESDKILGVFVDNNLLWSQHVKHLTKKMASNLWLLSKIKGFLSIQHRIQFYKSYVQPHIDYCNIVWGNTSLTNKCKIFRLQKRACRIILDYNVEDVQRSMTELKIMTIYDRVFFRKAKFMFKVKNGLTPSYISEMFEVRNADDTMPALRSLSSSSYVVPRPSKELFKNSMMYSGSLIWNILPPHVKNTDSVEAFHRLCLKWLSPME